MLNELKPKTLNKKSKTVGRGGKRGKTSGRGTKGQRARAGHKIRPEIRDRIKKLPKLRGRGKNVNKAFIVRSQIVNLSVINKNFENGDKITPSTLFAKGLIIRTGGVVPKVKILASGVLDKKVNIFDCEVSEKAKELILSSGGTISGQHE